MHLLNLSLPQFLGLIGSVSAVLVALYLLDRSRRRQVVSTLRFWVAAEQPPVVTRRRKIQQPLSLILQLISMALLLLAVAQLRWGSQASAPRDHVLILDTSAWMSARSGNRTLMDAARDRAISWMKAIPARDRIMLVRADGLTTPVTAFEPDRSKLAEAISLSRPGSTALNLDQALAFARRAQLQGGRRIGEITFVGTGHIAERDPLEASQALPRNLRFLPVPDTVEDYGLRRISARRSPSDPELWEIDVSAHNYGSAPQVAAVAVSFGAGGPSASVVGSRQMLLPPGGDRDTTFALRTRAAGVLEASLAPHDAFPADDRAILELPAHPSLQVTVYSDQPELLQPVLAATPGVKAVFRKPAEYRPGEPGLVVLDRFHPPVPPSANSIWIDPPAGGSPIPIRARRNGAQFSRWISDSPLGAGLRTKDFKLDAVSIFEAAPTDMKVGEAEGGPVIVARDGKPKLVVLGFHPALSPMRYELAAPLLFANLLHWMAPEVFRRSELSAGSVGLVKAELDPDVRPADVRVMHEDGSPLPFTLHERTLQFFSGTPGTVRVLAGYREYVYSLTLPQLWEAKWQPPADVHRGIPRFAPGPREAFDLWQALAVLGGIGLVAEWLLFGRFSRSAGRRIVLALHRRSAERTGVARR